MNWAFEMITTGVFSTSSTFSGKLEDNTMAAYTRQI